jgi:hypothetical protein
VFLDASGFGIFQSGPCQAAAGTPPVDSSWQTWTDAERPNFKWHNEPNSMTAATRCMKPMPAWPTAWMAPCEASRILVNEASRIERAQYLQATLYERCAQRVDYANGYKNKTVLTRLGEVT